MKNNIVIIAIVALIMGGLGFYGGMTYQKSQRPSFAGGQMPGGPMGTSGSQGAQETGKGMQPVSGEITASDSSSITVKSQNGSSTIVLFSDNTKVNKTTATEKTDLKVGEQVTAFGSLNTDGTITAESVSLGGQIRN
jgi:hypothetical protein